ncbi:hypothetical protein Q8A67_002972 [Cirrhinus molitorella]|uniref:PLA2c domain-containing protein n=1 Tax=Cirrhinus molitorella TaxID=172907 RepID=A0AA88Q744_9TELE|nr:hypothetical protein Q8A67_002972 [Cirrhinus molitorella]
MLFRSTCYLPHKLITVSFQGPINEHLQPSKRHNGCCVVIGVVLLLRTLDSQELGEVRITHSLNKKEEEFVARRRNTVLQCLQKYKIRCSKYAVPNIALLGSGGGQRAMVGLLESLVQLNRAGLLDCILYLSGISGSTWCMASLYKEPDWSSNLESVKNKIIKRLSGPGVRWTDTLAKLYKYYYGKKFFSLTDVWAVMLVTSYVKEIDESTLTNQWKQHSKDPFPLYAVIDKHCKQREEGDPWFEISPHEAGYSLTGAFVDTCNFGSQFHKGSKKNHQDEYDMLYLQAVCSSALADEEEIWKWIKDFLLSTIKTKSEKMEQDECYQVLIDLADMNLAVLKGTDPSALEQSIRTTITDISGGQRQLFCQVEKLKGDKKAAKQNMAQYTMDVCNYFSLELKLSFWPFDLLTSICICLAQWIWGRNYNFLHNMTDEAVPTALLQNETRDYIDAGLLNNAPYFSVLREERDIDLIISLDFSEDDPFMTVKETAKTCKKLNIPFPELNITSEDEKKPKDFYVFKGKNAPTVIHIPLFNVVNCGDKIDFWKKKYATFQGPYSAEMIAELMQFAGKNISNNREKLKEQIQVVAEAKCFQAELRGEVRIKPLLNRNELEFVASRRNTVFQALKKHQIQCSRREVPNIALLGSGGGQRAMVGLLGSLVELDKAGLLDCILYLSGVSGSTWCMASLYKEPNWSTKLETVKNAIIERLNGPEVSFSEKLAKLKKYYSGKKFFSLTDVWAVMVVTSYVKEINEQALAEQWDQHNKDPFPIYTVIDKQCKQSNDKESYFEINPHEAGYSLTGAFVDTCDFGSQFHKGLKKSHEGEFDMLYLQGLCGSAIADEQLIREDLWNKIRGLLLEKETILEAMRKEQPESGHESMKKEMEKEFEHHGIASDHDPVSPPADKSYQVLMDLVDMNLCVLKGKDPSGLDESIRKNLNDVLVSIFKSVTEWTWGRKYNFLHNMTDGAVPAAILQSETRDYEDAGLLNNSPYFSVLRKERDIDLIISLDFSDGDPSLTVNQAVETCRKLNIPFPEVNIPIEDKNKPKDVYVFRGKNAPTVIHMPLFNVVNCGDKVKEWRKDYRTFQDAYSAEMITKLMEVAGKNISNNKKKLLEEIRAAVEKKGTRRFYD